MPLSNEQVYERLHAAFVAIGEEPAETDFAETILETARTALVAFQMALLSKMDEASNSDHT